MYHLEFRLRLTKKYRLELLCNRLAPHILIRDLQTGYTIWKLEDNSAMYRWCLQGFSISFNLQKIHTGYNLH